MVRVRLTGKKDRDQTAQVLRSFSLALNQMAVYGPTHRVAINAADTAYRELADHLQVSHEMIIAVVDDSLMVNEKPVKMGGPVERALLPAMANLSLDSFVIQYGLTQDNFVKLIQILAKGSQYKPGDVSHATFRRALQISGVENVDVHHVRYERVRDDEKVVSKAAKLATKSTGKEDSHFGGMTAAADSFDLTLTAHVLTDLIDNPKDFAREILDVLERPQTDEQASAFVTQLGRAFETVLSKLPDNPTAFRNAARKIEKVRKQLQETAKEYPWVDDGRVAQLDGMLSSARDALRVEVFAEQYRKRREALEKSERQIAAFLKKKGLDEADEIGLRDRLGESGMSFAEWSTVAGRAARKKKRKTKNRDAISRIQEVAAELREATELPAQDALKKALKVAEAAGQQMVSVTDELADKIRELIEKAREPEPAPGEEKSPQKRLSRKELFKRLAEIAQELCQPLSVITASVDMIATGHLGEINDSQLSILKLAGEGAERMKKLVYALMELADVPGDLRPNQALISELY